MKPPGIGILTENALPSSMGLSVLIPPGCESIKATVTWGDYEAVMKDESVTGWRRTPRSSQATLPIPKSDTTRDAVRLRDSGGLDLVLSVRTIPPHNGLDLVAPGHAPFRSSWSTTAIRYWAFVAMKPTYSRSPCNLNPKCLCRPPGSSRRHSSDPDERVADLQYSDAFEYAVGHGVRPVPFP